MFNLALAKPARGQATIFTPTGNVAPIIAVRQNAWPRHARSPVALVALSNRAHALYLPRASALLQAPKRAGPQQRRASALLQARKARWGAASLGRRGRFAVGVAAGGLRFLFHLLFFLLVLLLLLFFFSAPRAAAFALPLAATAKLST